MQANIPDAMNIPDQHLEANIAQLYKEALLVTACGKIGGRS
jgi:hypothetical protein